MVRQLKRVMKAMRDMEGEGSDIDTYHMHRNSHMPVSSCARPPQKIAMPITMFGVWIPHTDTLYIDSMKVMDTKEKGQLYNLSVSG